MFENNTAGNTNFTTNMQMVQKWIGVALIRLVKNLQKCNWVDALPGRSLKMAGIQSQMHIFRRCVEKHQHCSCYSFTLYLPFVLIALRSLATGIE
jgi:hypothetical protein